MLHHDSDRGVRLYQVVMQSAENHSVYLMWGQGPLANLFMRRGLELRFNDLSYVKEGFRLLAMGGGYREIRQVWPILDAKLKENDRLRYYLALALSKTGAAGEARAVAAALPDMIDDIREGTDPVGELRSALLKS